MFVSKVVIEPAERIRQHLFDEYVIHQLVYSFFKPDCPRTFLYVADQDSMGRLVLTIQSQEEPNVPSFCRVQSKEVPEAFWNFKSYRFRVRIAPEVKSDGKLLRTATKEVEVAAWLKKREARLGVHFRDETLEKASGRMIAMKSSKHGQVTISSVDMIGVLDVVDRNSFLKMVHEGLGPHKGFGFGLVQLFPIKEVQ